MQDKKIDYILLNTLWSLEAVDSRYAFCPEDYQVYDLSTNKKILLREDYAGYKVVWVKNIERKPKSIFYHKIVALALINNGPYELIEHLDDNKKNNHPSNLKFSTKRDNMLTAYKNGILNHKPSIFEFCLDDGTPQGIVYRGTIAEISEQSGISQGTLYDRLYFDRGITSKTKYIFKYIREVEHGNQRAVHQGLSERKLPKWMRE